MDNSLLVSNIKKYCKQFGVNVTQLEQAVGISQGLISRWSKPDSNPSLEIIDSIATYLNIPISYLFLDNVNSDFKTGKEEKNSSLLYRLALEAKWRVYSDKNKRIDQFDCVYEKCISEFYSDIHVAFYTVFNGNRYLLVAGFAFGELEEITMYGLANVKLNDISIDGYQEAVVSKFSYSELSQLLKAILENNKEINTEIKSKFLGF